MSDRIDAVAATVGRRAIDAVCRRSLRREATLMVEGLEHVPATGPTLLVARHVHHLFDGCALWTHLPRPFRILVAVDWASAGRTRRLLDWACRTMGWPTVLRADAPTGPAAAEAARLLRQATKATVALLRAGEAVLVFPEGYPAVDPNPNPNPAQRHALGEMLPFRPGFARLATLAEKDGRSLVAVVPIGFTYAGGPPWTIALRCGEPLFVGEGERPEAFAARVEARVRALSGLSG
jgi:putative membrane protein